MAPPDRDTGTVTRQESRIMHADSTAVVLVGFQNDYLSPGGVVRAMMDDPYRMDAVLANTLGFLGAVADTDITMIATPMVLGPNGTEAAMPAGIMNDLRALGAFADGSVGAEPVPALAAFGDRITVVPGKIGFNAFSGTGLHETLRERGIRDVVIAGVLTSLCVDSTGRAAYELGYRVTVLADCATGRTPIEHDFYCANIFPLYGRTELSTRLAGDFARSAVA
jgi:nicotinamidase-related amidase